MGPATALDSTLRRDPWSESPGRGALQRPEHPTEIALVGVSAEWGDLAQGLAGLGQQLLGVGDAQSGDRARHADAELAFAAVAQVGDSSASASTVAPTCASAAWA